MQYLEKVIEEMVLRNLNGPNPTGVIRCEASEASNSCTGTYKYGDEQNQSGDIVEDLDRDVVYGDATNDFSAALRELWAASLSQPLGPWYRCNVHIKGSRCEFEYFWEGAPVERLVDLERDLFGDIPFFPFRKNFSLKLISQLAPAQVEMAIVEFSPNALKSGQELPDSLANYLAIYDWMSDTENGAMDQYYARDSDCFGGAVSRSCLYPRVIAGLRRVGLDDARRLFEESIALYAHYFDRVELARKRLSIDAVERQEESDIMERYYELSSEVKKRLSEYFVGNVADFAVGE